MSFERQDNSASAFKNDRKEKPTHADYTGTALIDGKEYWLNVWIKKDRNGNTYFSHSYRPKEQVFKEAKEAVQENTAHDDFSDSIPF